MKSRRGPHIPQAELVRQWNAEHPVGTAVTVEKDLGEIVRTKTRSKAWMLGCDGQGVGGHTAVIMLEGISGCYALERVKVIEG